MADRDRDDGKHEAKRRWKRECVKSVWRSLLEKGDTKESLKLGHNEMSQNAIVDKLWPETEGWRQRYQRDLSQMEKKYPWSLKHIAVNPASEHHLQLIQGLTHKGSKTFTSCELADNVKQLCGGSTFKWVTQELCILKSWEFSFYLKLNLLYKHLCPPFRPQNKNFSANT